MNARDVAVGGVLGFGLAVGLFALGVFGASNDESATVLESTSGNTNAESDAGPDALADNDALPPRIERAPAEVPVERAPPSEAEPERTVEQEQEEARARFRAEHGPDAVLRFFDDEREAQVEWLRVMEERLAAEPRDAAWADEAEQILLDIHAASTEAQLPEVSCRSSLCRFSASSDAFGSSALGMTDFRPWDGEIVIEGVGEENRVVGYIAREGYELPPVVFSVADD